MNESTVFLLIFVLTGRMVRNSLFHIHFFVCRHDLKNSSAGIKLFECLPLQIAIGGDSRVCYSNQYSEDTVKFKRLDGNKAMLTAFLGVLTSTLLMERKLKNRTYPLGYEIEMRENVHLRRIA